jgi:hypothetical protein
MVRDFDPFTVMAGVTLPPTPSISNRFEAVMPGI